MIDNSDLYCPASFDESLKLLKRRRTGMGAKRDCLPDKFVDYANCGALVYVDDGSHAICVPREDLFVANDGVEKGGSFFKVYFSPIKGLKLQTLDIFRAFSLLCKEIGLQPSIPCLKYFDEPNGDFGEIIEARTHPLMSADLAIIFLDDPSIEVKWDLQTAEKESIPLIILSERDIDTDPLLKDISVILYKIKFRSRSDVIAQLGNALHQWKQNGEG